MVTCEHTLLKLLAKKLQHHYKKTGLVFKNDNTLDPDVHGEARSGFKMSK